MQFFQHGNDQKHTCTRIDCPTSGRKFYKNTSLLNIGGDSREFSSSLSIVGISAHVSSVQTAKRDFWNW